MVQGESLNSWGGACWCALDPFCFPLPPPFPLLGWADGKGISIHFLRAARAEFVSMPGDIRPRPSLQYHVVLSMTSSSVVSRYRPTDDCRDAVCMVEMKSFSILCVMLERCFSKPPFIHCHTSAWLRAASRRSLLTAAWFFCCWKIPLSISLLRKLNVFKYLVQTWFQSCTPGIS